MSQLPTPRLLSELSKLALARRGLLENDLFIERFSFTWFESSLTQRHAQGLAALMDLSTTTCWICCCGGVNPRSLRTGPSNRSARSSGHAVCQRHDLKTPGRSYPTRRKSSRTPMKL